MEKTNVQAERNQLKPKKEAVRETEQHVRESMTKEKEIIRKSKETISQTNKKLQEIEEQPTILLDKEILDFTTRRKLVGDELRKKDTELKTLKNHTRDSLGALGGREAPDRYSPQRDTLQGYSQQHVPSNG